MKVGKGWRRLAKVGKGWQRLAKVGEIFGGLEVKTQSIQRGSPSWGGGGSGYGGDRLLNAAKNF